MIGKISYIGKNLSTARCRYWPTSEVCFKNSWRVWRGRLIDAWKQYFHNLNWHKIFIYEHFFLKNWQFNHKLFPPPYTYTVPEKLSSQSDKIWKQGDFKNPNFPTFWWIGKHLQAPSRLTFKYSNFPSLW